MIFITNPKELYPYLNKEKKTLKFNDSVTIDIGLFDLSEYDIYCNYDIKLTYLFVKNIAADNISGTILKAKNITVKNELNLVEYVNSSGIVKANKIYVEYIAAKQIRCQEITAVGISACNVRCSYIYGGANVYTDKLTVLKYARTGQIERKSLAKFNLI